MRAGRGTPLASMAGDHARFRKLFKVTADDGIDLTEAEVLFGLPFSIPLRPSDDLERLCRQGTGNPTLACDHRILYRADGARFLL